MPKSEEAIELNEALSIAIEKGSLEQVTYLLQQNVDLLNTPNRMGQTPLYVAISFGKDDVAQLLIELGADLTPTKEGHWNILDAAIVHNNCKSTVELLIQRGVNINQRRDGGGITPLYKAILHEREDIAKLLIQHGADLNIVESRGNSPLFYAVGGNHPSSNLAKLLIQRGAKINLRNNNGATPVHYAIHKDLFNNKSWQELFFPIAALTPQKVIPKIQAPHDKQAEIGKNKQKDEKLIEKAVWKHNFATMAYHAGLFKAVNQDKKIFLNEHYKLSHWVMPNL